MQFIAILRRLTERFSEADFAPLLEPEAEQARALYAEGIVRQIWSRGDIPGACMMIEAADEAAARASLATLPLMAAGMLEVTALVPLKPYRGFGPRG
ncbi:MAG: muconolactone Delta-isomerase family protein [Aliidongia sp.]